MRLPPSLMPDFSVNATPKCVEPCSTPLAAHHSWSMVAARPGDLQSWVRLISSWVPAYARRRTSSMCRARGSDKSCGSKSSNVSVVMLMTAACCLCSAAIFAPSVVATSPSAIVPAGGATPFDFRETFSAVCEAAMSRLSCPAGSVIMSNVGSLASPFMCQCGASANAPARVSKNIIDAVIQTRNDAAAPSGAPNFLCTRYVANCIAFMRVSGCTSYTVTGCGGGGRLDNFSNVCQCNAPFILTDPSSRLGQLLVDARLYAQVRVRKTRRRFLLINAWETASAGVQPHCTLTHHGHCQPERHVRGGLRVCFGSGGLPDGCVCRQLWLLCGSH